jgi:cellulose synthase/poly-beta-1,6-N-acetylglucosamine synthase-like glycosyltransferase
MTRFLFWAASTAVAFSYAIFPALLVFRGAAFKRPHRRADITPSVAVIVAAHNEIGIIERKVRSVVEQNYPADRLTVVVASDGSDDGTPEAVAALGMPNVRILDLPRGGKAAALTAAVADAEGDVLVFSDANSILAPNALRHLVRAFADPDVGGVAGNQVYVGGDDTDATAIGERSYWDFDRLLKQAQTRAGSLTQGTGALYAIRRDLFQPIPPDVNDDFFESLSVVAAGRRLVFEPEAVAYERVAASRELEYGRRVRIMTRGLRCVAAVPAALDPRRTGFYAVQVIAHKVLMRVMAVPLAIVAATSLLLAPRGTIYRLAVAAQALSYALAAVGLLSANRPMGRRPWLALPAYFTMIQVASLHAAWNLVRGRSSAQWQPARGAVRNTEIAARPGPGTGPPDPGDPAAVDGMRERKPLAAVA